MFFLGIRFCCRILFASKLIHANLMENSRFFAPAFSSPSPGGPYIRAAQLRRPHPDHAKKQKRSRHRSTRHHAPVAAHALRFAAQPRRPAASVHSHEQKCADRDQSAVPHSAHVQALRRPNGFVLFRRFFFAFSRFLLFLASFDLLLLLLLFAMFLPFVFFSFFCVPFFEKSQFNQVEHFQKFSFFTFLSLVPRPPFQFNYCTE